LRRGAVRVERACETRVDIRANRVARIAGAGGVIAELRRKWKTALQIRNRGKRPSRDEVASDVVRRAEESLPRPKGQVVRAVDSNEVADVCCGRPIVEPRK